MFFVKTHNALLSVENVSLITPDVTAGAIYLVRDPRDIAISYAHHLGRGIDDTIAFMADPEAATGGTNEKVYERLSDWSAHVHFWTRTPNPRLLILRFEDMLRMPEKSFGDVIRFLGQPPEANRLARRNRVQQIRHLGRSGAPAGFRRAAFGINRGFLPRGHTGAVANGSEP